MNSFKIRIISCYHSLKTLMRKSLVFGGMIHVSFLKHWFVFDISSKEPIYIDFLKFT